MTAQNVLFIKMQCQLGSIYRLYIALHGDVNKEMWSIDGANGRRRVKCLNFLWEQRIRRDLGDAVDQREMLQFYLSVDWTAIQ